MLPGTSTKDHRPRAAMRLPWKKQTRKAALPVHMLQVKFDITGGRKIAATCSSLYPLMIQVGKPRGMGGENKYAEQEESNILALNFKKASLSFYHISIS